MNPYSENVASELVWVKPAWSKLQFELHSGEAIVATLGWTGGSSALGRWGGGPGYQFKRMGWWRPRIVVYAAESGATDEPDEPIATFTQRGGALSITHGRAFLWKKPKRLTTERIWVDESATELVRCQLGSLRAPASVTLAPAAATLPETPLLVLLGQYLCVTAARDAVLATTAATTAVIASS